jgi:hypothetical protein
MNHPFDPPFIEYIWPATLQALEANGLLGQVLSSEDALFRDPLMESEESGR